MNKDDLWQEYQICIDLYKFYVDITVKILIWYYGITGAILSFYFSERNTGHIGRWALLLPCAMSIALAVLFGWGARHWQPIRDIAHDLAERLQITHFELRALQLLLYGATTLLLATATVIVFLIVWHQ